MNIYLNVPYSEKDQAKLYGARWDAVVRRWYYTEKQDPLLFEKWFEKETSIVETSYARNVTLREFVKTVYGDRSLSLTRKAAKAFGVPYPLQSGWLQRYGERVANSEKLVFKRKKDKGKSIHVEKSHPKLDTPKKVFKPLCSCAVEPWEDCEHTEELANKAMMEILK